MKKKILRLTTCDHLWRNKQAPSGPSESARADYDFMIVPTESSSSESSELLVMIQ